MNHTTHSVFMVPPSDFSFNHETGEDNEFQQEPDLDPKSVQEDAMAEFNQTVNILRDNFIEVLLLHKTPKCPKLPDAVFPNNWFSTDAGGVLTLYPMKTPNRQAEVRPDLLVALAQNNGYKYNSTNDLTNSKEALEGTGSIIFDHKNKKAYAAISERCDQLAFEQYVTKQNYQPISFKTKSSTGNCFYHTNVMLSIGEGFAAICLDAIVEEDREKVINELSANHKQIIELGLEQTEKAFCANILQLRNTRGELIIVMSDTAYHGFTKEQKNLLKLHGKLVPCPIDTIEKVGGGSARCMLAENFLPSAS